MGTSPSFLTRILGSKVRRYFLALAAVAAAFLVNSALHPLVGDRAGYVLLFPAVAFSAWYCGIGPSIVATLLALVGSTYGFTPPIQPFRVFTAAEFVRALVFLCSSAAIVAMGESRRRQNESACGTRKGNSRGASRNVPPTSTPPMAICANSRPACSSYRMTSAAASPANSTTASDRLWPRSL